jgi:hypothetical protein
LSLRLGLFNVGFLVQGTCNAFYVAFSGGT